MNEKISLTPMSSMKIRSGWLNKFMVVFAAILSAIIVASSKIKRWTLYFFEFFADRIGTEIRDFIQTLKKRPSPIIRLEVGEESMPDANGVAIMVQFSPTGHLSAMVREQIKTWRNQGLAVVLVSNSPSFPDEEWQAARHLAALVVHRRNEGLDFGAWKDVAPIAMRRWPSASELLLVNDSVLGPFGPITPFFEAMRAEGDGVYGFLESMQRQQHIQSWFVMVRGSNTIKDVTEFLSKVPISVSKDKIIRRGELRLANELCSKGHKVSSFYSYEKLIDLTLSMKDERNYLANNLCGDNSIIKLSTLQEKLLLQPINPSHYLWRVLIGRCGFPFIKTELILKNPMKICGVENWPQLLPTNTSCDEWMIREHLNLLSRAPSK